MFNASCRRPQAVASELLRRERTFRIVGHNAETGSFVVREGAGGSCSRSPGVPWEFPAAAGPDRPRSCPGLCGCHGRVLGRRTSCLNPAVVSAGPRFDCRQLDGFGGRRPGSRKAESLNRRGRIRRICAGTVALAVRVRYNGCIAIESKEEIRVRVRSVRAEGLAEETNFRQRVAKPGIPPLLSRGSGSFPGLASMPWRRQRRLHLALEVGCR